MWPKIIHGELITGHVCDGCCILFLSYSFLHFSFFAFHSLGIFASLFVSTSWHVGNFGFRAPVPGYQIDNICMYWPPTNMVVLVDTSSFSRLGTMVRHRVPPCTTARKPSAYRLDTPAWSPSGSRTMSPILSTPAASMRLVTRRIAPRPKVSPLNSVWTNSCCPSLSLAYGLTALSVAELDT